MVPAVGAARARRGDPPVRVVTDTVDATLGEGEPAATIRTSDFELARALLGRRSQYQVDALVAEGDPAAVGRIAVFGPRNDDLDE